jgi:hypothetical protein
LPLGPELLGLVAAGAAGAAIGLIVWGVTQNYSKWLQTARMGSRSTLVVRVSGLAGNMARGLAVLLVATTLFVSAVSADPMHAKSLDAALKALAAHPGGGLLLVAIGVGFLSFSVHSAMERAFDACRSTSCAHECPGPVSSGMNRPSQPAATAAR